MAEYDRKSDVLRIEVKIEEDEGRAELIEEKLHKLVDVMPVEKRSVDGDMEFHPEKDGRQER